LPSENEILAALSKVTDPELGRDVVSLHMVQDVKVDGGVVSFTLNLTTPACPLRSRIEEGARGAVMSLKGVKDVKMKTTATVYSTRPADTSVLQGVKNIIAVASGKGGVGKSTVAVNLAAALSLSGAKVGVLDADIYGPNIPHMLGVKDEPKIKDNIIVPPVSHGIKVASLGFFYKDETPLIWRGPMVSGAVKQLLTQVEWGDLDYLIVDLPPGCLPSGTLVMMADRSPRPIEKVREGESVMSFDGRELVSRKVLGVVPQGKQKVFRLKTPNRTIVASGNHPFLKYHRRLRWRKLEQLKKGDRIISSGFVDGGKPLRLPSIEHESEFIDMPTETTAEFVQIVGHFVGDGLLERQGARGITGIRVCEPRDGKHREQYERLYRRVFRCNIFDDDGDQKFGIESVPLAKLFAALDLDHSAGEKKVPDWIFGLPVEQRLAFIRGYSEAVGHIRHRTSIKELPGASGTYSVVKLEQNLVSVEASSEVLVRQLHELCLVTGLRATNVRKSVGQSARLPGGRGMARAVSYAFKFSLKLDRSQLKLARVKSIEPAGEEETYDLQVEEYQNFVANSLLVHNTGDSSLTLAQTVPLGGVVIVSTPQEAALSIASKALAMFRRLNVPILGVVENMSYFVCPKCGEKTYIFAEGGGRKIAKDLDVDFLGEVPLGVDIREQADRGVPLLVAEPDSPHAVAFKELAFRVAGMVSIVAYAKMKG
jgi:Mrp family chromosome partitioning ATPase